MVVAQIGMRKNIIADALRLTKPAAMANHQPSFGPKDGQMVANGFGIGRTNADVDQGDPRTIRCDEMVCWHLVATPSAVGDQLRRVVRWRVDI